MAMGIYWFIVALVAYCFYLFKPSLAILTIPSYHPRTVTMAITKLFSYLVDYPPLFRATLTVDTTVTCQPE